MAHEQNGNGNGEVTPMRRLQTALALNRAIELQPRLAEEDKKPAPPTLSDRTAKIFGRFVRIHRDMYKDTHGHPEDEQKAGTMLPETGIKVKEIMGRLANELFNDNAGMRKLPRNKDGKATNRIPIERLLAEAYHQLRELDKAFFYGNRDTFNFFFDNLTRQQRFTDRYGHFDLRRLENDDVRILNDPRSSVEQLMQVFAHALTKPTPRIPDENREFPPLPSEKIVIGELPFLHYVEKETGKEYLVTVNSGLIELTQKLRSDLETFIREPKTRIAQFKVIPEKYLGIKTTDNFGREIDMRYKSMIDGYPIGKDGSASLMCLDCNPITGLSSSWHEKLMEFIKGEKGENSPIFRLRDVAQEQSLEAAATGEMKEVLKEAAPHVRAVTEQLDAAKKELFLHKHKHEKPYFFMSMGGPGSGKEGATHEIARLYCRDDYVTTSLDGSRDVSDTYKVLREVGHHADDYKMVEEFARALRKWVADGAREEGYNLLYDGTGIEFRGEYDKLVKDFKNEPGHPYHTTICAVDTMLAPHADRQIECEEPVVPRIVKRLKQEGQKRALPWYVTVQKHILMPLALMHATELPEVDKLVLVSNDGPLGTRYVLGETFKMNNEQLNSLKAKEKTEQLHGAMLDLMRDDKTSIVMKLAQQQTEEKHIPVDQAFDQLIRKIPAFENGNVGFLAKRVGGQERVFMLNNVTRMVDLAEKGLLYSDALGLDTLNYKGQSLAFALPSDPELDHGASNESVSRQKPPADYQDKVRAAYNSVRPQR